MDVVAVTFDKLATLKLKARPLLDAADVADRGAGRRRRHREHQCEHGGAHCGRFPFLSDTYGSHVSLSERLQCARA